LLCIKSSSPFHSFFYKWSTVIARVIASITAHPTILAPAAEDNLQQLQELTRTISLAQEIGQCLNLIVSVEDFLKKP
jgi:hypothetical protein